MGRLAWPGYAAVLLVSLLLSVAASAAVRPLSATIPGLDDISTPANRELRQRGVFVGEVAGTNAFIAIKRRGDEVVVYVCDGQKVFQWFSGKIVDGKATLEADNGMRVIARFGPGRVNGTVALVNGAVKNFVARPADGEPAGLFREERDPPGRLTTPHGWIILPDGRVRGDTRDLKGECGSIVNSMVNLLMVKWTGGQYDQYQNLKSRWNTLGCASTV